LMNKVPYYTTVAGSIAAVDAIEAVINGEITVHPLQDYFKNVA
jgi:carbamoyl-phosphate synthase large subunit